MRTTQALSVLLASLVALPARGHHEAIFGPQSSLVLSAPAFVSAQIFSRRTSPGVQETTGLLSAGFTPFSGLPLSLSAILPATVASDPGRVRMEDAILGARYRLDLGRDGNFLLGMAALEVPTGNMDHAAFDGPLNGLGALLGSLESGPFSGIAYGFAKSNSGKGSDIFSGAGFAWTPFDDPRTERLLSFQLGASFERRLPRDGVEGVSRLMAHPTVVWGPGGHTLLFAVVSLPVVQRGNPAEQDAFRLGVGGMYLFGTGH